MQLVVRVGPVMLSPLVARMPNIIKISWINFFISIVCLDIPVCKTTKQFRIMQARHKKISRYGDFRAHSSLKISITYPPNTRQPDTEALIYAAQDNTGR